MLEERRDTMGGDFNYIVSKYTPFDKIIENLKKKYRVQSLTEEEIPNLAMHRFNTAHLPAIEFLGLSLWMVFPGRLYPLLFAPLYYQRRSCI